MQSEQINELAAALSKAQGIMGGAVKGSSNPFFKSSYADLGAVMEAARHPLASNGLSFVQLCERDGDHLLLCTLLMHSSGQWVKSFYPINPVKADPQGVGSAITYARRYSLSAMLGIPQVDDDGEAASGRGNGRHAKQEDTLDMTPPTDLLRLVSEASEASELTPLVAQANALDGIAKKTAKTVIQAQAKRLGLEWSNADKSFISTT